LPWFSWRATKTRAIPIDQYIIIVNVYEIISMV